MSLNAFDTDALTTEVKIHRNIFHKKKHYEFLLTNVSPSRLIKLMFKFEI